MFKSAAAKNHYISLGIIIATIINAKIGTTLGATYPSDPYSDPPAQWSSMSKDFDRHCSPFGVSMFAQDWPEDKFIHACNLLAQMLDNDQDGCADDVRVVKKIRRNQAGMAMFETENTVDYSLLLPTFRGQGLWAEETELGCSGSSETRECRDAAIEEILHVVTGAGLGPAFPKQFGECFINDGDLSGLSTMQKQMDIARGGHFPTVPATYPENAIYHYDDTTCMYGCMGTEFLYWAVTSLLDGQDAADVAQEWEANTKEQLQAKLPGMYDLLADNPTNMKLISLDGVLPGTNSNIGATGTYAPPQQTCPTGCGLDGAGCGTLGNDENVRPCPACRDSRLRFKVKKNGKNVNRRCGWAASNNTGARCQLPGVKEMCPGACETCSAGCTDSPLRIQIKIDGNKAFRSCAWVANKFTSTRCAISGVAGACRKTCDNCPINGEEACEGHGYTPEECAAVGNGYCCDYNEGQCWSRIGREVCPIA